MQINSFDKEVCDKGLLPVHVHPQPHACLIVRGAMVDYNWQGRTLPACPGELLFNPAGTKHLIETDDSGLVCIVVELFANIQLPSSRDLSTQRPLPEVALLVDKLSTPNPASYAIVRSEIVAEIDRTLGFRDYVEPPGWLTEAQTSIGATTNASIGQLAAWAGVHRATLSKRFCDTFGLAPEHYKMLVRLERAADLLGCGVQPVIAAQEAGFSDQAHFNRSWRRYLGGTPGRWLADQATIVQDNPAVM